MKAFKDIDERFKAKDKHFRSDVWNIDKIRLSKAAYHAKGFINASDEIRRDKDEEGAGSVAPLFAAAEIISLSSLKDEREKELIMEGYGRKHHEDKFIEEPSSGGVSEPDRKSTGRDYEPERKGAGRDLEPERKGAGRGFVPERKGAGRESDPERKGDTGLFGKEREGAKRRSFSGKDTGIRDKKEYRKDKGKVERRLAAKTALATGIKNGAVTLGSAENVMGEHSGDLIKDANKGSVKAAYNTGRDAIRRTGKSFGKKIRRSIGRFFRKIALALGALIAPLIPVILVIIILVVIIASLVVSWNHSKTAEDINIPVIKGDVTKQIWGGLKSQGYSDETCAAMIGNAFGESGLKSDFDDGDTIGLFGFSIMNGEAEKLKDFATGKDRDWDEVSVQLSYFIRQHPSFEDNYLLTDDVEKTTDMLCRTYFQENEKEPSIPERQRKAAYYFKEYQGEDFIGSDIVAFALQYVGNPYVFGGNSLTDGIDCSHFVYQCLKHTGHYEDEYVMSTYWNKKGVKVDGVNDLRPGDIAVYKGDDGIGHVVIVDERVSGNTFWIVHAKGRDYGIVHEEADIVNYHGVGNLLGFRRF